MKVKWNNCFLCLNDLDVNNAVSEVKSFTRKCEEERGESDDNRNDTAQEEGACISSKVDVLLYYLLKANNNGNGGNDNYEGVIDGVRRLLLYNQKEQEEKCDGGGGIKFCCKCEGQLTVMNDLHRELEVVWRKLVIVLRSVRATVVQCSKRKDGSRDCFELEMFEEWLREQERQEGVCGEEEQRLKKERTILSTLYAFQAGVVESAVVPKTLMDHYTFYRPDGACPSKLEEFSRVAVKTEAEDLDPSENQQLLDVAHCPTPEPDLPVQKIPQESYKRKQGGKKIKNVAVTEQKFVKLSKKSLCTSASLPHAKIPQQNSETKKQTCSKDEPSSEEPIVRKRYIRVPPSFTPKSDSKTKNFYKPSIYYGCRICPFTTRSQFTFEHHLRTHEISAAAAAVTTPDQPKPSKSPPLYHCEKCENVTFSLQQHYEFHKAGHDGLLSILCDFCNQMWDPADLVEHMKTHLKKVFPCPNCSYCSSTRQKYLYHNLRFHASSSSTLECDICLQVFKRKKHLLLHYYEAHQAIEKLVCGVNGCTKEFLDLVVLQGHRKIHTNSHQCSICERSFQNNSALKSHLRTHTGEKPFTCTKCAESFNHKQNLEGHYKSKHGAPKFKCDYCDKEYNTIACRRRHMAIHTGSEFTCEQCGKKFGSKQILKRHYLSHSPFKNFVCEECGLGFKFAQHLKRHLMTHNGTKSFKCEYCGKAFLFQKYLIPHLRIHTGEKPYVCDTCGKAFNQYPALYQHRRRSCISSTGASSGPGPHSMKEYAKKIVLSDNTQKIPLS